MSKLFDIKLIENNLHDGYSLIRENKPRFVVSWFSTAICESLSSDVVPITLAIPSDTFADQHTIVYPLFKRSISWPSESQMLYDLLDSKTKYKSVLKKLKLR